MKIKPMTLQNICVPVFQGLIQTRGRWLFVFPIDSSSHSISYTSCTLFLLVSWILHTRTTSMSSLSHASKRVGFKPSDAAAQPNSLNSEKSVFNRNIRHLVVPVFQPYFNDSDGLMEKSMQLDQLFKESIRANVYRIDDEIEVNSSESEVFSSMVLNGLFDLHEVQHRLPRDSQVPDKLERPNRSGSGTAAKKNKKKKMKTETDNVQDPLIIVTNRIFSLFNSLIDYDSLFGTNDDDDFSTEGLKFASGKNSMLSEEQEQTAGHNHVMTGGNIDMAFSHTVDGEDFNAFAVLETKENLNPLKLKKADNLSSDLGHGNHQYHRFAFGLKEFDWSCLFEQDSEKTQKNFQDFTSLIDQLTGYMHQTSCPFGSILDGMTCFFFKVVLSHIKAMKGNGLCSYDMIRERFQSHWSKLFEKISNLDTPIGGMLSPEDLEREYPEDVKTIVDNVLILRYDSKDGQINISEDSLVELKKNLLACFLDKELDDRYEFPDFLRTVLDGDTYAFIPFNCFIVKTAAGTRGEPGLPIQATIASFLYSIFKDREGFQYIKKFDNSYRKALGNLLKKKSFDVPGLGTIPEPFIEDPENSSSDGEDSERPEEPPKRHKGSSQEQSKSDKPADYTRSKTHGTQVYKNGIYGVSPSEERFELSMLGECLQGDGHLLLVFRVEKSTLFEIFPSFAKYGLHYPEMMILKLYDEFWMRDWFHDQWAPLDIEYELANLYGHYYMEKAAFAAIDVFDRRTGNKSNSPKLFATGLYGIFDKGYMLSRYGKFLLMEYIVPDEDQIKDILRSRDEVRKERVLKEAIMVVRNLNEAGVKHGDLAIRNLIISGGNVKIFDFSSSEVNRLKVGVVEYEVMSYEEMETKRYSSIEKWKELLKKERDETIYMLLRGQELTDWNDEKGYCY